MASSSARLQDFLEWREKGNGLGQSLAAQRFQILIGIYWRIGQSRVTALGRNDNLGFIEVLLRRYELIRVDRFQSVLPE
jgi:hypothetical protein